MHNEKTVSQSSFEEIYTRHSRKVYNLALRMTGDNQLAEDITQETFIQIYKNLSGFRGDSQLSTWIYSIARSICLRQLENKKRKSYHSIELLIEKVNLEGRSKQYSEPEKQFYINQVKDGCLLGVMRCLSLHQRMAFILRVLYDLPVNEVAAVLGKSENSTRILVHRARKTIREFLCNNCSLYDVNNHCHCENLISFSLQQDWIQKYNPTIAPELIESELRAFKNEIKLYQTISTKPAPDNLRTNTLSAIKNQNLLIFSAQKVK
jgi:RNA polymerase sigma-70 factor (ECF subfamily)